MFHTIPSQRAVANTPGTSRFRSESPEPVCCLRRDMSGSAIPFTFRLII